MCGISGNAWSAYLCDCEHNLSSSRVRLQCQAASWEMSFACSSFLVHVPRTKMHYSVLGVSWITDTGRSAHPVNIIRLIIWGQRKAVIHLDNHLGQACWWTTSTTRAKWVIIIVMMIITSHPSREKIKFEQIICWLIFSHYSAHRGNWVYCGWAANNDELSIPAIILTIITALLHSVQWQKLTPWEECRAEGGIFVTHTC